jgi:hypothetical protein
MGKAPFGFGSFDFSLFTVEIADGKQKEARQELTQKLAKGHARTQPQFQRSTNDIVNIHAHLSLG